MRAGWSLLVGLLIIFSSPLVEAQETDLSMEMAKRHFKNGKDYYNVGDYKAAMDEFRKGYKLEEKPAFLFNIGRCLEGLSKHKLAIETFQSYLVMSPKARNRHAVELRIKNIRRRIAEQNKPKPKPKPKPGPTPKPEPVPKPEPIPEKKGSMGTAKIIGWTAIGLGALGAVGAGVFGALMSKSVGEYEDLYADAANNHALYANVKPTLDTYLDRADRYQALMFVSLGVGVAAAVTGTVLLILNRDGKEDNQPSKVSMGAAPGGSIGSGLKLTF